MRFFLSPLLCAAGILLMKYSVVVTDQFSGKIEMAEKYLGTGIGAGTYTFWKLVGLGFCILSVLWFFGVISFSPSANSPVATTMLIKMLA